MTRSLPEKTFEHWCSIHLNYRYRSHLQMWWPSSGADIEAARIPGAFGKRLWLELKTVEWNSTQARHDLSLDLQQLEAYASSTVPDYYVFPIPVWQGILGDPASSVWLGTLPTPLLAYQTRSKEKWFADWTFVVPGHILRSCLAPQIAAFRATGKGETMRIAEIKGGVLTWTVAGLASVHPILWKSFWKMIETCGSSVYPAQFVVPGNLVAGPVGGSLGGDTSSNHGPTDGHPDGPNSLGGILTPAPIAERSELVARLRRLVTESKSEGEEEIPDAVIYSHTGEDSYALSPLDGDNFGGGFAWNATRALVLIEAGGLRL